MSNQEELPKVAVLIPTYERPEILKKTIELIRENLKYQGWVGIIVGDDSKELIKSEMGAIIFRTHEEGKLLYFHHKSQYGLGRNLNSLLQEAQDRGIDYVIQMDDDHWLVKSLDITPHVKKLIEDETAGAIRLWGIGGHRYRANLDGSYWRIDWNSPELYIASNRPHLKSISRFHGAYGLYPEGLKLGLTEESFCHTCIDSARLRYIQDLPTIDVLIPLDVQTESGWQHSEQHGAISWQARGF